MLSATAFVQVGSTLLGQEKTLGRVCNERRSYATINPCKQRRRVCMVVSPPARIGKRLRKKMDTEVMSVLLPEKLSKEGMSILEEQFTVVQKLNIPHEELLEEIPHHDAIIVRSGTKVSRDVVEAGKKLKVIGRAGVGVDNIDLSAATEHGILVVNAPTGNCVAAAEHAVALICAISRHIAAADATMKAGEWNRNKYVGVSLVDKTIAIIGLGRIGREVARRCLGLGMRVIAHDPYTSEEAAQALGVRLRSIEDACQEADFLSMHLPLTDGTRDLINAKLIGLMKPEMRIINAARGGVINEPALLEALDSGKIAGAGLDCFVVEPPHKDKDSTSYRLSTHEKVVATPHLGASTKEAQEDVAIEMATAVRNALSGEIVPTMVNAPAIRREELLKVLPRSLLAERLGRLARSLSKNAIGSDITIRYCFSDGSDLRLLRAGFVKGIMQPFLDVHVSIVNADSLVRKHGLKLREVVQDPNGDSDGYIAVEIRGTPIVEGRVIGGQPVVTRIGRFEPEQRLYGYLLLYVHDDKPGQIGKMGTFLGEKGINISFMTIARGEPDSGASSLVLTGLDEKPSADVLEGIKKLVGNDELHPVLIDFH